MKFASWTARAAVLVLAASFAAACSGDDDSSADGAVETQQFNVVLTSAGCEPAAIEARTGPATFTVTNRGAAGVTEFEILEGDRIVGEVENIVEGLTGKLTLNLRAGEYTTYCPGGSASERGTLIVAD